MAGVGRRTLYRKSVTDQYLNSTPEPGDNEEIALVQAPRGSNIIEIMLASGEQALAILPTRFRKLIWVKRGDFLIASTSAGDFQTAGGETGKVRHRVEYILNKDQIKHLKRRGLWPDTEAFGGCASSINEKESGDGAKPCDTTRGVTDEHGVEPSGDHKKVESGGVSTKDRYSSGARGDGNPSSDQRGEENADGKTQAEQDEEEEEDEEDEEDDMSDLFVNNNRAAMMQLRTDHDDDDDDDDDDDSDSDAEGGS